MARDPDEFDPESPEEREIGREMVDRSTGLGSVMAHLYRGEVDRMVNRRSRLDSTTNWAVTVIAGILAYAVSNPGVAHATILVGMLIGVVFLLIEARRFQRYDIWRSRVRSIQENLFADALNPAEGVEQRDWRRQLSRDYRDPGRKVPLRDAVAHRLRRVYLPLLGGLPVVWLFRLTGGDQSVPQSASVFGAPGWVVLGSVGVGFVCLLGLAFAPSAETATETGEAADRGDLETDE